MPQPPSTFAELLASIVSIINTAIPLLIGITIAYFVWKIVDAWVINAGDENKVAEGKQTALVGVLVLFVMITIWGILAFLQRSIF